MSLPTLGYPTPTIIFSRPRLSRSCIASQRTQAHAAKGRGADGHSQPEVSRLFKGHFREYSVDRLIGFLTACDRDVEIVARPRDKRAKKAHRGHITFRPVAA